MTTTIICDNTDKVPEKAYDKLNEQMRQLYEELSAAQTPVELEIRKALFCNRSELYWKADG